MSCEPHPVAQWAAFTVTSHEGRWHPRTRALFVLSPWGCPAARHRGPTRTAALCPAARPGKGEPSSPRQGPSVRSGCRGTPSPKPSLGLLCRASLLCGDAAVSSEAPRNSGRLQRPRSGLFFPTETVARFLPPKGCWVRRLSLTKRRATAAPRVTCEDRSCPRQPGQGRGVCEAQVLRSARPGRGRPPRAPLACPLRIVDTRYSGTVNCRKEQESPESTSLS